VIEEADIAIKSPGDGLAPTELELVIGRRLVRTLEPDEPIALDVLESSALGMKV
jgi:sialic acid synthase SpsE